MAKKKWDQLDEEAEKEANAIKRKTPITPRGASGKRIAKQRRMHALGGTIIQTRIEKRYVL